jgi:N utilization substance protein B
MSDNESKPAAKKKKASLTTQRRNARSFALQALYSWTLAGQSLTDLEAQFRVDNDMADTDIKLFSELLHNIAASKSELDGLYSDFLDRQLEELDPVELNVLRIGAYELSKRIEVPYRVAINESVELAKVFGATESHRYVNGILDKLAQRVRMAEVKAKSSR